MVELGGEEGTILEPGQYEGRIRDVTQEEGQFGPYLKIDTDIEMNDGVLSQGTLWNLVRKQGELKFRRNGDFGKLLQRLGYPVDEIVDGEAEFETEDLVGLRIRFRVGPDEDGDFNEMKKSTIRPVQEQKRTVQSKVSDE